MKSKETGVCAFRKGRGLKAPPGRVATQYDYSYKQAAIYYSKENTLIRAQKCMKRAWQQAVLTQLCLWLPLSTIHGVWFM